jgi:hypothetical protein
MVHPPLVAAIASCLAAGLLARGQPPPSDLAALAARAHVERSIVAWCRGEFRPGGPGGFAAAIASESGSKYVVLEADGIIEQLGAFAGTADLSCYTRSAARQLDGAIRRSDTIHGHVAPRWNTTVVCGFTDDTTAVCWQYSPADRRFVTIGGWVT